MSESTPPPASEILQPFVESDANAGAEKLRANMTGKGYLFFRRLVPAEDVEQRLGRAIMPRRAALPHSSATAEAGNSGMSSFDARGLAVTAADAEALKAEQRLRYRPAVVQLAEQRIARNAYVVEKNLAELAVAGEVHDGA